MAYFKIIDGVIIVEEDNVLTVLKKLKPDVFYTTSKDWRQGVRKKGEKEALKKWQGKLIKARYHRPSISSSQILALVDQKKVAQTIRKMIRKDLFQPLLKVIPGEERNENQLDLFKRKWKK